MVSTLDTKSVPKDTRSTAPYAAKRRRQISLSLRDTAEGSTVQTRMAAMIAEAF